MSKKNLFNDLMLSLEEARAHDEGKLTLKSIRIPRTSLSISSDEIIDLRKNLGLSQGVFAAFLRTNKRTYQRWEQGVSKPNDQAIALLKLVNREPAILNQIAELK